MPREVVDFFRSQYPPGSRIKLREMREDPCPLPPGSMGKLDSIDDTGTFHVKWDNGRSLGVIIGQDSFDVLPPELTALKLYMPLTAEYYERDGYGDLENDTIPMENRELLGYEDIIRGRLEKYQSMDRTERGLMEYYDENDGVNAKVRSMDFRIEARKGVLWGVAECRVAGELTPEELNALKDYVTGQASDGLGEGFEQQEIEIEEGEMYVHFWSSRGWDIQTEQERFGPKLAEGLPEMCFSTLPGTGELICIKRGESGYYPSDWNTSDAAQNREIADYNNQRLGVTRAQEEAMRIGSMVGWDAPGADPKAHEEAPGFQMGGMAYGS